MAQTTLQKIKKWIDGPSLKLFSYDWSHRIMGYLSYQHKRSRRRILEKKLRSQGLYGDVVQQGPFAGLHYPADGYVSCRFQKIVGVYEHELHPLLNFLIKNLNSHKSQIPVGIRQFSVPRNIMCCKNPIA